jgi:GNAT superfamily N-acetyltransferase
LCTGDAWRIFRDYHYLSGQLSPFTKNYVAVYKEKPVAFIAIIKIHMGTIYYRVSRLVVLPDYQGISIGRRLLNFMAKYYTEKTKLPFTIITSNPQLVRGGLKNWKIQHVGRGNRIDSRHFKNPYTGSSEKRITVSLRYLGEEKNAAPLV